MKYDVILADPPWGYEFEPSEGAAAEQYDTSDIWEDIECANFVKEMAANNCALFCWGTWPKLPQAMILGNLWGFRYCTVAFVWVKTLTAVGQLFLVQPDLNDFSRPGIPLQRRWAGA